MAPRSALANISFTVDSASEDEMTHDELNALPTPESNTENKAPARKARELGAKTKKPAPVAKATVKGRPATRRVSGSSVLGVKKSAPGKGDRKALAERKDANGSDTEEVDDFDEDEPVVQITKPSKRGRPAAKKAQAQGEKPVGASIPAKKEHKATAKEPALKRETKTKTVTKSRTTKRAAASAPEPQHMTIPETQPEAEADADAMDIEESIEMDEIPESMPPPPRPSVRRAQAPAKGAQQTSSGIRRTGSVSDSERDPVLRRKVGDLTRRLEIMTVKYDTIKDAASSGKESNFEQLKKKTEQTAKDQDAVIQALKQQISDLQSRTLDLTFAKKEIAQLSKENGRLNTENKRLEGSLASAQNESKTLSTKLAAARSVPPDTKHVPGSAVKNRSIGVVLPGTAEAAKEAQLAKQKVDLYSDLTNLVVLGLKKNDDEEDVYDCLQTGRNGTLHFHLTVASGSESYEDTEFIYQPLLNEQRDRELLDLLPDYLTEEIYFPRGQAAKFYCKVVDSMSRKIILEEE